MLTKKLLSYRLKNKRILPQFIKVCDQEIWCNSFLEHDFLNLKWSDVKSKLGLHKNNVVYEGLLFVLEGFFEFTESKIDEMTRYKVIELSQQIRSFNEVNSMNDLMIHLSKYNFDKCIMDGGLYGDNEDDRIVNRFNRITTDEWISKYNSFLRQTLLLMAKEVEVYSNNLEELENILSNLDFDIKRMSNKNDLALGVLIDTKRAASQFTKILNSFGLKNDWQLKCTVIIKKKPRVLQIDQRECSKFGFS